MDEHENAKDIAVIKEQLKQNGEELTLLRKSYGVLNDFHGNMERQLTVIQTEWNTTKGLIKWLAGGSAVSVIVGVIQLLKMFEII